MKSRVIFSTLLIGLMSLLIACGPSREAIKTSTDELLGGTIEGDFAQTIADGDALWAKRLDRASLEGAIAAWEKAITYASPDLDETARRAAVYETYVKIARAYYFLTDGHIRFEADDIDDLAEPMKASYDKGIAAAERAVYVYSPAYRDAVVVEKKSREQAIKMLDKGAIPGLYWYATNLGKWALLVGLAETLGHVDSIFAIVSFIEKNDEGFFHYAPLRYFGGYYTKLPFPGGDPEKSNAYFQRCIEGAPYYLGTRVLYADMYATKEDDEDLFREQLEFVLNAPDSDDPDYGPENAIEKKKAQKLLDNIYDYF